MLHEGRMHPVPCHRTTISGMPRTHVTTAKLTPAIVSALKQWANETPDDFSSVNARAVFAVQALRHTYRIRISVAAVSAIFNGESWVTVLPALAHKESV